MKLEVCNPTLEGFRFILEQTMGRCFPTRELLDYECDLYFSGETSLWTIAGKGFLVLAFYEDAKTGERFMEVRQGAGKCFYTDEGMTLLKEVAAKSGCERMVATPIDRNIKRLLQRLGFESIIKQGPHCPTVLGEMECRICPAVTANKNPHR